MTPCVKWTNDCQGKKDYDGPVLTISTRYWPANGGFHILDSATGEFIPNPAIGKPTAKASFLLHYGDPADEHTRELILQHFEAETEVEVKVQVEAWVQGQFERYVLAVEAK